MYFGLAIRNGVGIINGWMAKTGDGKVVFLAGIMNYIVYLDVLKKNLKECTMNLILAFDGNFILQQHWPQTYSI